MSLRLIATTLLVALLVGSGHSSAQNPTLKTAMRLKLTSSQPLLEAVVKADFAAITRSAEALSRISNTEIISWQSAAQTEYLKQATMFMLSVQGLGDAAANRDVEAALREYTNLVSSCTRCHAHVRRSQVFSFELPGRGHPGTDLRGARYLGYARAAE
jgi:cytochrome c556